MIRELSTLAPEDCVALVYGAIASAVVWGALLGICAIWLSTASRGGRAE